MSLITAYERHDVVAGSPLAGSNMMVGYLDVFFCFRESGLRPFKNNL